MTERVDAIVVGLGAAGAIVAEQLAAAGLEVVGLDKGPHFTGHDFRFKHDELRYFTRQSLSPHMGTDPMTWRSSDREQATVLPWAVGAQAMGPLFLPPSSGSGGGTVHWAAWSWRSCAVLTSRLRWPTAECSSSLLTSSSRSNSCGALTSVSLQLMA